MTDARACDIYSGEDLSDSGVAMAVEAESDDGPDADDGMFISKAAMDLLYSRASSNSRTHCGTCTCRTTT